MEARLMTDLVSLEGRTIIVTGAAQGIGRAITELAIGLGGAVVALDLNGDALKAAVGSLPSERVMTVTGSVLAADTVEAAVKRFGAVHGLVNNAGITRPAMIEKMTLRQWQEVIDVHLTGAFYWLQAAGRHMVQRARTGDKSGGSIVNISSDAGRKGSIGQINYAAAKAGMFGLTMSAAREWGKFNVRTNSICFGVVETPMTEVIRGDKFRDGILTQIPMGRWAQPEEVVKTVCFLLSDASSYITGQHLAVNGGFHISV
jgi:3-oxoacyl-[acyl-carrier protein] reductase